VSESKLHRQHARVVYAVGFPETVAGSQRSLGVLVDMVKNAVEPTIVVPVWGKCSEYFSAQGVRVSVVPNRGEVPLPGEGVMKRGRLRSIWFLLRRLIPFWFRVILWFHRHKPDILHANDQRAVLLYGPPARLLGLPVIWHRRGLAPRDGATVIGKLTRNLATCSISVSRAVSHQLEGRITDHVIYNAYDKIDLAESAVERPKVSAELDGLVGDRESTSIIVTASTPAPYKGLHHLAQCLHLIDAHPRRFNLPPIVWVVLGEPNSTIGHDYLELVQGITAQLSPTNQAVYVGWKSNPMAWIESADVLVLPTVLEEELVLSSGQTFHARCSEGLPRVVLEAMLVGTPVLATDVAGVSEMISSEREGIIVSPGSPEALASGLRKILLDGAAARDMSKNAEAKAREKFHPNAMRSELLDVYSALVGPRVTHRGGLRCRSR
jgi:glycosyltransferase involved in cell wall biosynthesis